jgi:carboxyl-terminal processing protease
VHALALLLALSCIAGFTGTAPLDRVWLESFDTAWRIVHETYYDPDFNGIDWQAVKRELRPRVEEAATPDEARGVIREMISRLRDSHFSLIPHGASPAPEGASPEPTRDTTGDPGIDVRYQDGVALIVGTAEGGPARAAGVRPGWIIDAIDGEPVGPALVRAAAAGPRLGSLEAWRALTERLRGPLGTAARLSLVDGTGKARQLSVERRAESGQPVKLGMFPTLHVRTEERPLRAPSGADVGYIRFSVWLTPVDAFVARAVDAHRDAAGIVLDLRGNPGGLAAMLMGVAGHFVTERVSLGEMRTREGPLTFYANPRTVAPDGRPVTPFSGRVAILVDRLTGSASECFAGGMQAIGRARIFGEQTMGQALPALFDRLPSGDLLVHAYADFVTPADTRLEGRGVEPDVSAPWSRSALLDGQDSALALALQWAGER